MIFGEYIRGCRNEWSLTQEELVHALYRFDSDLFGGLDTTTLSKWERGVTQPRLNKKVIIIKFFQDLSGEALPCFDSYDIKDAEEIICETGMRNIIAHSKSKKLILNFPSSMMAIDDLKVYQLIDSDIEKIEKSVGLNAYLDKNFNKDLTGLGPDDYMRWALLPGNRFWVCEFGGEMMGLLFVLKLKRSAFGEIMDGLKSEKELQENDFALDDELGSSYIISFFSLNQKVASMLFVRFYAYLISHQKNIAEVGAATMMNDGEKLIDSIDIPLYKTNFIFGDNSGVRFFRANLKDFLSTPKVIKMIMTEQECQIE